MDVAQFSSTRGLVLNLHRAGGQAIPISVKDDAGQVIDIGFNDVRLTMVNGTTIAARQHDSVATAVVFEPSSDDIATITAKGADFVIFDHTRGQLIIAGVAFAWGFALA